MWDRVEQYLADLSFPTCWESGKPHDYYIPENIFYRLCMKAKNEVAESMGLSAAHQRSVSYLKQIKTHENIGECKHV